MLNRYYSGPPSDHFDGHRFFNPHHPNTDRSLLQLLRWRFGGKRATWPATIPGRHVAPERHVDGLRITMIGHATVLIQAAGRNLLVDPTSSERAVTRYHPETGWANEAMSDWRGASKRAW